MKYLYYTFIIWNIIVFFMYGLDKLKSIKKWRRIPEITLVFSAMLLGGLGATMGMLVFNHKTKKPKFRFFVPLALLIWIYVYFYVM